MIGIIGAMDIEIEGYLELISEKSQTLAGPFIFYTGKLHSKKVVIVKCGIGKVCASSCTSVLIDRFKPSSVINTGVAGGTLKKLGMKRGDIVIATDTVHHDVNVMNFGYEDGQLPDQPRFFKCDESISRALSTICKDKLNVNVFSGRIASADRFVCKNEDSEDIIKRFAPAAIDMESASIGQVCTMFNVPYAIIRSISDSADDDANDSYEEFALKAAKNAITLASEYIKSV